MRVARPVLWIVILFASGTATLWIAEGIWDRAHGAPTFDRTLEIVIAVSALALALLPGVRGVPWFLTGVASSLATWASFRAMRLRYEATNVNSITAGHVVALAFSALLVGLAVCGLILLARLLLARRRKRDTVASAVG